MAVGERAKASRAICQAVMGLTAFQKAHAVFVFVGMPGEPDTDALIDEALAVGKRVCVPRCGVKPRMDAVPILSRADLRPGTLGIPEPPADAPAAAPEEIDLALIPCLSAGRDGSRLGHGAGYYDAYLAGRRMQKICLCFEVLVRDSVPMMPLDIWMDAVITEKGIDTREGTI